MLRTLGVSIQLLVSVLAIGLATPARAQSDLFTDDFERADGVLDGWTVNAGDWNLVGGQAVAGPSTIGTEQQAFAGNPPVELAGSALTISFDWNFIAPGDLFPDVGRHAGCLFFQNQPGTRGDAATSGYQLWWIDRESDRGLVLARWDGGALAPLNPGTFDLFLDPPSNIRIEVVGEQIQVFGDDILAIDVVDGTHRGGNFGLWTWDQPGQHVEFDNVEITGPDIAACFTASTPRLAGTDIFFDAGCSVSSGTINSWEWDFGDGQSASGQTVEHTYDFADNYTVTLTIEDDNGSSDVNEMTVAVAESLAPFSDDFDRADGPVDGWLTHSGAWSIVGNQVEAGPTTGGGAPGEHHLFAGDPPGILPDNYTISFDWNFLAPADSQPVGRHAGCYFSWNQPGVRWDAGTSGYQLWWIDRGADRGLNLARWDGVAFFREPGVGDGTFDQFLDPPTNIRIEVEGPNIRIFGDDELAIEVSDNTYRGGLFGFWTWDGAEQHVQFDNVEINAASNVLAPCMEVTPSAVTPGTDVFFSAACSQSSNPIVSWDWDFGDGQSASGEAVEHTYAFADSYVVTLTVEDNQGSSESIERTVIVSGPLVPFEDDFERAAGPVDGWTVFQGEWNITEDGRLDTFATGGGAQAQENWVWAGSPPALADGDFVAEFNIDWVSPGDADGVGRHGGVMFNASEPSLRWSTNGYFIDWIDRASDFGIRFTKVVNGALQEIVPQQTPTVNPVPVDPPQLWRIEVQGPTIRFFGDGVLYIELDDEEFRSGHFGFWAYGNNNNIQFDDVIIDTDVDEEVNACFNVQGGNRVAGSEISFDASCSFIPDGISPTYSWDMGDGTMLEGEMVAHTYAFADNYVVTLTVDDNQGGSFMTNRSVSVSGPLEPFAECFDDGLANWTAASGDWTVTPEGVLETNTIVSGGEAFLYAGSPPAIQSGDFFAEVDWTFVEGTNETVGRHGAVHFFWNLATTDRFSLPSSGYTVFYIDREGDRGLTLARFDGTGIAVLNDLGIGGTPDFPDPPETLGIEVDGDTIRVYHDGDLAIEAFDETYREGFFSLWAWQTNHVQFDNVRVGTAGNLPSCGGPPVGVGPFIRGDCNQDLSVNLTDGIFLLNFLFLGGLEPECTAACDNNADGDLNITTAVFIFNFLFLGGPEPPAPTGDCARSSLASDIEAGCSAPSCP